MLPGGDLLVAVATACSIALQPTKACECEHNLSYTTEQILVPLEALKLLTDTELWLTDAKCQSKTLDVYRPP